MDNAKTKVVSGEALIPEREAMRRINKTAIALEGSRSAGRGCCDKQTARLGRVLWAHLKYIDPGEISFLSHPNPNPFAFQHCCKRLWQPVKEDGRVSISPPVTSRLFIKKLYLDVTLRYVEHKDLTNMPLHFLAIHSFGH